MSLSKLTKYCACHEKWISWLILVTHETLFTMRGATSVIVQTHQILRLPRKMNLMIDPWHKWNVIYNARSNMRHSPNSPNTAPATKNDRPESQRNLLKTDETSFPMRGRSDHDPTMIRAWSEHDPTMIRAWSDHETVSPQPASQPRLLFTPTTSILYWKLQHFALRLSFQISPNTAPATKSSSSTSPNTAPATKKESHDWSLSHMKHYLQCAEQQVSLSKLTKYCACHAKWISWLILDTNETLFTMRGATCVIVQTHQILRLPRKMTVPNLKEICWKRMKRHFQCAADPTMIRPWSEHDPTMIRAWSEHDPTMKPSVRNPPRNRGYFSRPPRAFCIENYNISRSGYHSKFHRILRLPRKVPVQHHQILRLPRKVTLIIDPNSPNAAPATKSDTDHWSKLTKCCACHEKWHFNFTKYCACHWAMTWRHLFDTYYLTTPITWRHLILDDITWRHLLLDDTYYLTTPNTWRHYLTTPNTWRHLLLDDITWRHLILDDITWRYLLLDDITWRHLLLDDTYYLTTPTTWRHLLLDDTYYLTTPITWRHYLTTPTTWRHLILHDITWRHLLLDDTYYWTTWLDDTYYLTTPTTWRHYLTTPITWRHYLTTPITWRCDVVRISEVSQLNFLRLYHFALRSHHPKMIQNVLCKLLRTLRSWREKWTWHTASVISAMFSNVSLSFIIRNVAACCSNTSHKKVWRRTVRTQNQRTYTISYSAELP